MSEDLDDLEEVDDFGEPLATRPPAVVFWFRVYAAFLSLLYFLMMVVGVVFLVIDPATLETDKTEAIVIGVMLIAIGGFFFCLVAASFFFPPRPWAWIYDLILIGVGMTSACTLPACVALIIFWMKPATKRYFGRSIN
ncbi:MAG: hypothetical protein JWP89_4298 [Schlesneria sp.]|nr:hypothetical protein [Schlesneria sp.]